MLETPKTTQCLLRENLRDKMDNQQATLELGWLLGLIDGEGCFTLGKSSKAHYPYICYKPCFQLANTNKAIIDKAQKILQRLFIPCFVVEYIKTDGRKNYWRIDIYGLKRLRNFFYVLFDYFECRKDQASVLKRYVDLRLSKGNNDPYGSEEEACFEELKFLNSRGASETI